MSKKVKILLSFVALCAAAAYFYVASSFIADKQHEQRCRTFSVSISDADVRKLVTEDDVKSILLSSSQPLLGEVLQTVDTYKAEELLNTKSFIKNAEAYTDISGTLNVRVEQRKPIIRIASPAYSFYMDEEGFVFPLSKTYAEYVPIVTGSTPLPFNSGYKGLIPDTENAVFLKQLLTFAQFLQNNTYWNAMVEQVHVVNANNVELVTRVGSQLVELGSLNDFEYKLHKLHTFYKKAMPTVGWNTYKTINLAYSNQVVCK